MAVKIAGAVLIMVGTTYYGWFMCFKQRSRLMRLKAFKETLLVLSGQIRYGYTSIPEAFIKIAEKSSCTFIREFYTDVAKQLKSSTCQDFSAVWKKGISQYVQDIYLSQEDCHVLDNVGNMPLYLDGQMQIQMLEETVAELETILRDAQGHISEKCRIYKCTGFAAGVFLVLVLI